MDDDKQNNHLAVPIHAGTAPKALPAPFFN